MISRCSSPMPEMMVCPISSSVIARKVGSSLARAASAIDSRSCPSLVLGSMATEIDRLGELMASRTIGFALQAERVARLGVPESHRRRDVTRRHALDLLAACWRASGGGGPPAPWFPGWS